MYNHTYMDEMIADSKEAEISLSNLELMVKIKDKQSGEVIRVPIWTVTSKYKDLLSNYVDTIQLSDNEMIAFKYRPKALSNKLYGTTELWQTLLELNGMLSVIEFNKPIIKFYNPHVIKDLLNEFLIIEGRIE